MTKQCLFGRPQVRLSCWLQQWILIMLLPCVHAQLNEDQPPFTDVYARSGDTVLLPCPQELPTPAPPLPVALFLLQWQRTDSSYPFYTGIDSQAPIILEPYDGRVSLPDEGTASLQITNVSHADAGTFRCQVLVLNGDYAGVGNGTFVNLIILRAPEFLSSPPPSVVFREGDTNTLQCLAKGIPTPEIQWYKQGQQLRSTGSLKVRGDTITFEEVKREHGGTYLCRAENSEGAVQNETRVIIEGAPLIFVPPQDAIVLRSHNARFDCEFEASPSNVSQRWYYEGAVVQELEQFRDRHTYQPSGALSIHGATVEDEGNFACSPSNGIGEPPTAFAYLTVQYAAFVISMDSPVYAARSEPVSIPCLSDAKPTVSRFIWRKNQREIAVDQSDRFSVSESGTLTIHRVEFSDIGAYSCIPYNVVGTEGPSDAAILRVIEKPSFACTPANNHHRKVNQSVTFKCIADGNPPLEVEWRKVGGLLPEDRHVITSEGLTIGNLTKEDTGVYECSITNEVATVTASANLFIQMTSPHMPHNISVLTSSTSAYVWWSPGYNGGMDQRFTVRYRPETNSAWSHYTDIPDTVSSIVIHDLRPTTEYEFSVTGRNDLGASGWTESITVATKGSTSTSPPRNLTLSMSGDGLLLSWLPPVEGAELVSHYALEYWIEGPWLVLEDRVAGDATEHLMTQLTVNTTYSFRLVAFGDGSFSHPSQAVVGDTWGLPMYRPTKQPQYAVDITGILAGVLAVIFCLLCILLLACFIVSCKQRRNRNKRMVFFSVVDHSDQSSDDSHRYPASTQKGFLGKHFSGIKEKFTPKPKHPGYPSVTVEPARSVQQNLRERLTRTSITGRAGVYHVSSSEGLNTTVGGHVGYVPTRHCSDGSEVNGSDVMEAEELNGIRLMEATEHLDSNSDGSCWETENVSLQQQRPHVKFQLTSYPGKPTKADRGRVHPTDGPSRLRPSASSDRVVDPSELRLDREYTTHTFDPGSEVAGEYNQYAHPPSDCNYSCNGEEGDPYVNGLAEPLQNEVFLDDLPGYGTDGVFQARTVHYDEVPDELTYQAEALYASLRDEIPKRKFGVHEYALERSPSDEVLLPCDDNLEPLPSALSHEYLQLEQPTYAYPVNTKVARMTSPAGIRLSNDSGLNSDHSGQDSLQTNSEIDTFEASPNGGEPIPSRQGHPPVKSTPRPSNQSLPAVSISPLSMSTNQECLLSSADPQDVSMVGPLPDFGQSDSYQHRKDTLSPQESHHSLSSGYGSRNTSVGPRGRDSGPFVSEESSNLPNASSQTLPDSGEDDNDLTKKDPRLEQDLLDALRKFYESDDELSQSSSSNPVYDLDETEKKEKRCEELKREFEEYRREQSGTDSGAKSPRKTTVV
ncbi:protein turtle homolog A-like isoform X2 [Apostichopus japonicus]|uniref:protein turtle homolog A-like isoform X2 n=1 Tax=Stichopus japonicus TaxID=307972 RepID=UPI003AB47375